MGAKFKNSEDAKQLPPKETVYKLPFLIEESERTYSPWDIRDEDVNVASEQQQDQRRKDHRRGLQSIATKTMATVLGAITVYSIATGDQKLLGMLTVAAVVFLTRLVQQGVTCNGEARNKSKSRPRGPGHDSDDG